jgi:hypothetical protein
MVNAIYDCRHGGSKSFGVPKVFGFLWTGTPFSQSEKLIFFKFLVQLQIVGKKYYLYFLIPMDLVLYLIRNLGESGVLGKMFAHRTGIA